ncbi:MAG: hypothetical protein K0B15_06010 [Lentimicrobium sp.]|nr:hypothetical protein [Lentimicrobium sp.]
MKKLFLIFLSIMFLVACNNQIVQKEHFDDGSVKSEKTFEKSGGEEKLVKEVVYHPNGQKYMEGNYKDNLREGYWASWFDDGTLWSEGEFKAGESHGKRKVFHSNGALYYEGTFDMGKRVGIWTFYDEKGVKTKEIDYNKAPEMKE